MDAATRELGDLMSWIDDTPRPHSPDVCQSSPEIVNEQLPAGKGDQFTPTWIMYSEAAKILDCDTSTITVYVRDGKLKSNGDKHKKVRVTKESVALLKLEKDLKKPDRKKADKNDARKNDPPMNNNPERPTDYERAKQLRLQSTQDD
jgi:hypothetical protein